ncbi:hypothetical protein ACFL5O_10890, partial [Myxococcota bacterium]
LPEGGTSLGEEHAPVWAMPIGGRTAIVGGRAETDGLGQAKSEVGSAPWLAARSCCSSLLLDWLALAGSVRQRAVADKQETGQARLR